MPSDRFIACVATAALAFPLLSGCIAAAVREDPEYATHAFMGDPRVRQAFSYAFDDPTSLAEVYAGYETPLAGPIPKGMPFSDVQSNPYSYDPARAEAILDAAGYTKNAQGLRFGGETIRVYYPSGQTTREMNALLLAQDLQQIGVSAKPIEENWPQYLERVQDTHNWDIAILGWGPDYNDPDDYMFPLVASLHVAGNPALQGDTDNTGFSDPVIDKLLIDAKYTVDPARRLADYQTAYNRYITEPNYVFIGQEERVRAVRTWVTGYQYNPLAAGDLGLVKDYGKTEGPNPSTMQWDPPGADIKTMDPADAYDLASGFPIENIYDTLVGYPENSTSSLEPRLATSWDHSPDGLTWTFHLRRGVLFSNGDPMTADDVVYSFQFYLTYNAPTTGVTWILNQFMNASSVVKIDDSTVQFHLTKAYGGFLPAISFTIGSIIDKAYCEAHGGMPVVDSSGALTSNHGCADYLDEHPMGTGAYELQDWTKTVEVTLRKSPSSWWWTSGEVNPHAPTVFVYHETNNPEDKILDIKSGEADFANVDQDKLGEVEGVPGITIDRPASFYEDFVVLQTTPTMQ